MPIVGGGGGDRGPVAGGVGVTAAPGVGPRRWWAGVLVIWCRCFGQAALVEQRAKEAGLTMSAFVRQAALGRPASPLTDVATVERLLELLTQALRKAQLSRLLNTVADDVAHIRGKIGA